MARRRKSKSKGIKEGKTTDKGTDTENKAHINTEATAKAPLASDQINHAAKQDSSQAAVKGKGTNSAEDENIKECKEVLKIVEKSEEESGKTTDKVTDTENEAHITIEATTNASLPSDQLNHAAQQDSSQAAEKGTGTNSGLDETIKEWREVLKMVEESEEGSVHSLKIPPTKISSNGLHRGRGEMGETSLNVEFNTQSELLLVGQLLGLPLLEDSAKRSLKYIQQVHMMQYGRRLESNILTEADIASSATQFLVDIQLMPFAPNLGGFRSQPDPNSYVLQTDDERKKVTYQAVAKKLKKKRKTFSDSNNGNSASKSPLITAETEEVMPASEDVLKTTSAEIMAVSRNTQLVQTERPRGRSSSLSPDENNVHVPDPCESFPEEKKPTSESSLFRAQTEEVEPVSKDVQKATCAENIAVSRNPQEIQAARTRGSPSSLSTDEKNVHVPDPSKSFPEENNSAPESSLIRAKTKEVEPVSKDVQKNTSAEKIAVSQNPQEVQAARTRGSPSSLSPDENNVHLPDPSAGSPEENNKDSNKDPPEVLEVPAHHSQKDKKRRCPLCTFEGFKLPRHMKKHVKEGKIRENEIPLWVKKEYFKERAAEKEQHAGKNKPSHHKHERNHFLCKWQGCTAVVNRPSQHLKRFHDLSDEMVLFARRCMELVEKEPLQRAEGLPPKPIKETIREDTKTANKGTKKSSMQRESLKKRKVEEDSSESDDEDESVPYADSSSSEDLNLAKPTLRQNERMMEQIQMDLDDAPYVSEDEDDEGENIAGKRQDQDWHAFYTDITERSRTQRGKLLAMFYDWLQHVEGGERKKTHSLQHVRQVHTILEVVEPNGDGLRPLTHDFGMAMWNEWAAPRLRTGKLSHGTVRNYILSLECFCQFLTTRRVAEKVDEITIQRVQDLHTRLPKWRKTVHRRGAVEDTERFVKESEEALTPEDVKSLENSEHARKVIKTIAEMSDGDPVTKKQFTEVRDYLLTTLILQNGARTGVVENCTVKQFNSAKKDTEGNYVVLVTNHKTTRTFGPVRLIFKPTLYSHTSMYVQEMLPMFGKANGVLFPSNRGKSFRQSNVGKRVSKTFRRANIRIDINVTATRLRKFHTGRVFYRGADAQELVADHMAHLTTTARKKYRRVDLMERSTAAFQIMQENIRGSATITKSDAMCADDKKKFELGGESANHKADRANCEDGADVEVGSESEKHKDEEDRDEDEGILTTLSKDTGHSITISEDEKAILKTLFKEQIQQGVKMSEQLIRDQLKTNTFLKVMLVSKDKVRNVQRWILREQRKSAAGSIANLPVMDAAEKTANYVATNGGQRKPVVASEKSTRQSWSKEDTKVIKRKFSELAAASETGTLTKAEIQAHWKKDAVLRAIYQREETFPGRTYIKVKTIFRWNSLA